MSAETASISSSEVILVCSAAVFTLSMFAVVLHLPFIALQRQRMGELPSQEPVSLPFRPAIVKNCSLLREGEEEEVWRVKQQLSRWNHTEALEQFSSWMSGGCPSVARQFSDNFYVSQEEVDFPIAFVLLVHTNPLQVVRLLRAIYRPHNLYCIHPDAKQSAHFISVFRKLAACLPNVIVASELQEVYWGYHTMMDGELTCMQDLLQFEGHRWKYVINIGGQELPLKTNREMVGVLRAMEGASGVHGWPISPQTFEDRFTWEVKFDYQENRAVKTDTRLPAVPHNITIYKNTHFCALTRVFLKFMLFNQKAVDFRNFMRRVWVPEEEYYSSLYKIPEAPSGHLSTKNIPLINAILWTYSDADFEACKGGYMVHHICILTIEELGYIFSNGVNSDHPKFFFNKYYMEHDHVVMDCMEERLYEQNTLEYLLDIIEQ